MASADPALPPSLPRSSRWLRLLRLGLRLGALYDLAFALLMVAAPGLLARVFDLPLPGEPFYLYLMAIFLAMLAAVYLLAAYDPLSYRGVIDVAIAGRAAGAAMFTWVAFARPELGGLWAAAAGDAFFAVFHAVTWWPLRRLGKG